jgi:hypothetical protein
VRIGVVIRALGYGLGQHELFGRIRIVDMMIVDAALVSFIALVLSLMVIPERRSAASTTETPVTA